MQTYPWSVSSGINITPESSGVNQVGTSSSPFNSSFAYSFFPAARTVGTSYLATANDTLIFTNQGATIVISLAVQKPGKNYAVISTVSSLTNTVIVSGIGCTIDGAASKTISTATLGGASVLYSDGGNYWTLSSLV